MGTLISLERAQALRNPLAYLAPALLGAGSLALIAGAPALLAQLLLLDGGLAFLAVAVALWFRAPLPGSSRKPPCFQASSATLKVAI